MAKQYFYETGGKQFGPVAASHLKPLAAGGQVRPEYLIWEEGTERRIRAKDIKVHLDPTAVEFLIEKGTIQPTALDRCAALWRNTWRIRWPRISCEGTSSRATRWMCTRLVNNWRSRWLERNKVNRQTGVR